MNPPDPFADALRAWSNLATGPLPLGEPIGLLKPPVLPHAAHAALKLLLVPSADAATAWLAATDAANRIAVGRPAQLGGWHGLSWRTPR